MGNNKNFQSEPPVSASGDDNGGNGVSQNTVAAASSEEQISWPAQTSASSSGLLPPSPSAADIIRQVSYPTCPSLGMADISIPLYTVKTGDLEVPISISYRSSGIKVDEIAGPVGLGWTLNAGGSVVQEVRGERETGIRNHSTNTPTTTHSVSSLSSYICREEDTCPDKFYYSYPGGGGSFFTGWYDINTHHGKIPENNKLTFNNDIIELDGSNTLYPGDKLENEIIDSFRITDPYGRTYDYNARDHTSFYEFGRATLNGQEHTVVFTPPDNNYGRTRTVRSGWNLGSITSADRKNQITFSYCKLGRVVREPVQKNRVYKREAGANNGNELFSSSVQSRLNTGMSYESLSPKKITFNGNTVNFSYTDSPTPDDTHPTAVFTEIYDPNPVRRLSEITVVNCNNEVVRRIVFKNRDGEPSIRRYKLNAVEFYDGEGNLYDQYRFAYCDAIHNGVPVPDAVSQPPVYAQDHFGYYNGQDSNTDLHFVTLYDNEEDLTCKRQYNFKYAQHQALTTIQRLSGAITHFSYEPNSHLHPTLGEISIGIRIKEIRMLDSLHLIKSTRFAYEQSGTTIDFTKLDLSVFLESKQYKLPDTDQVYECLACSPHSLLPGAAMENATVFYGKVIEETTDHATGNVFKTEYFYDTSEWTNTYVKHGYVKQPRTPDEAWKYIGIPDTVNSNPANPAAGKNRYVGEIKGYFKERPFSFGNLTRIKKYECLGNGGFSLVEESEHRYAKYNEKEKYTGIYVKNMVTLPSLDAPVGYYKGQWVYYDKISQKATYADNYMKAARDCYFFNIHEDTFITKLTQTIVINYYGGEVKGQAFLYNYNVSATPIYKWPCEALYNRTPDPAGTLSSCQLKKVTTRIDNDIYTYRYLYCDDYGVPRMDQTNLYQCVGKETLQNNVRINSEYTKYTTVFQTDSEGAQYRIYLPCKTIKCLKDETIEEIAIDNFDSHFNPVCISVTGNPQTCYVWSYAWMYPVAEIKGVGYEELLSALGGDSVI